VLCYVCEYRLYEVNFNFDDKRRSLGRYSSLANYRPRSFFFGCNNCVYEVACILKDPKVNPGRGMETKTSFVEEVARKINLLALQVGAGDIPE
jgi:hypothetical protein